MSDLVCIDKILLVLIIIGFAILYIYSLKYFLKERIIQQNPNVQQNPNIKQTIIENKSQLPTIAPTFSPNEEVLVQDYRVARDPFMQPIRRDALYQIPQMNDPYFARMINMPTNYYYDMPSIVGYVTRANESNIKYQLYGYRDPYNKYKTNYYAYDINTEIKFDIALPRNSLELMDKDVVVIDGHAYVVTLYPNDYFKYNPSIF